MTCEEWSRSQRAAESGSVFLPLAPTTKPVLGESHDVPVKSLSRPISTGLIYFRRNVVNSWANRMVHGGLLGILSLLFSPELM